MPEPAKRVAFVGLKRAEEQFKKHVEKRVVAERAVPELRRELEEAERDARALEREVVGDG